MAKELVKNTGIYIFIGFFAQAIIFLLWIILAWWLVPSQIGIYALVLFVIEFFSAINIFGLDAAITRFYYVKERVTSILGNALVIFSGSSIFTLLLFFSTAKFIPLFVPGLSNILEENLPLFGAIILANSATNFALVHYMALKKALFYAKFQLLKTLFFFFISLILVYSGLGILGVFYAMLGSSLLIVALFIVNEKKIISFRTISPQIAKNMISYSFPLVTCAALGIVSGYFGRLLLDRYTDLATLGVYSFFLMLTLQINGLWSSFSRAWTPEIFSKFLENKKEAIENIKFMTFLLSFLYLSAIALFIILGKLFLFNLIFKEIYLSNIYIFYILLLMPLFSGIYIVSYPLYYYEQKTRRILFISLGLSLVTIFLTFFMVKSFSQNGAALSVFIMSIFTTFAYLFAFQRIMQIPSKIINWTLFLSVLMTFNVLILLKTFSSILFLIFIILSLILTYKKGNLSEKKYLFFSTLYAIKNKDF